MKTSSCTANDFCIFREEEGLQLMQEMKTQYSSGMQSYCQKANVMFPSSVSSTSAGACSGMVSRRINLLSYPTVFSIS